MFECAGVDKGEEKGDHALKDVLMLSQLETLTKFISAVLDSIIS